MQGLGDIHLMSGKIPQNRWQRLQNDLNIVDGDVKPQYKQTKQIIPDINRERRKETYLTLNYETYKRQAEHAALSEKDRGGS